tara:strand:- start:280 stop:420 length:141 start_codon:yes stop_codon:yes gene_type:complete
MQKKGTINKETRPLTVCFGEESLGEDSTRNNSEHYGEFARYPISPV